MKRFFCLLLCLLMLLPLASCSGGLSEVKTPEETEEAITKEYQYKTIKDKLSWEKINAFPIAPGSDMTPDELRQLCVDFFQFSKSALWIPDETFDYIRNSHGTKDQMKKGMIYGGLPYIGVASGNVYRLMDWMDEETGVVDMSEATKNPKLFGNQCSLTSYWGWARVINSANYTWTNHMQEKNGFLRVGPYTYSDEISNFTSGGDQNDPTTSTTKAVCEQNGEQTMFESYAQMKMGDGMVQTGHVVMCSVSPVVVRNSDNTINGKESYLYLTDQGQAWEDHKNEAGDQYQMKGRIDSKQTFEALYQSAYLPFTFAELLGTDPCEASTCTIGHEGEDKITIDALKASTVSTNYSFSDIYIKIKNKEGEVKYEKIYRAPMASVRDVSLNSLIFHAQLNKFAEGDHTVEITCQLGTGERKIAYSGTLIK